MSAHTPGPWKETAPTTGDVVGPDGIDVAYVYHVGNASLIVQAPAMYDALIQCRSVLLDHVQYDHGEPSAESEALDAINAILEKLEAA